MECVTARTCYQRLVPACLTLAVALSGCARVPPATIPTAAVPSPSVTSPLPTATDSTPATTTSSPSSTTASATSTTTASATATSGPAVKATGSLKLFADASKKLTGSCQNKAGVPTLSVADKKNDFFNTIEVVLTLAGGRKTLSGLTIELGEDSELITRRLTFDAAKPAAGTSAKLTVNANTYQVTGKLANAEDGTAAGTMPVTLKVTCAGSNW